MDPRLFDVPGDNSWCPGCGNFPILDCLKEAAALSGLGPEDVVVVSGIGQAAKLPHYFRSHFFNGLHGRALPVATAIQASNPGLKVICVGGDGDMYGEGGNHFLHSVRRNPNILHMVHNNMVYGLTKGQASPTSPKGMVTPAQVNGVFAEPFNPLAVAISLGASFVARVFCAHKEMMVKVLSEALAWEGYSLVDIFQPCVSFNKINTYQWFRENTKPLGDDYDPTDRMKAIEVALKGEPFPVGVIYKDKRAPFHSSLAPYADGDLRPLYQRPRDPGVINDFIKSYR